MTRNAAEVPKWTGQRSQSIIYKKDILALYYIWMGMLSQSLTSLSPYAGDCVSSGIIPSRQRSCSFELSFILVSISQGGSFICLPFLEARARRESEKKLGGEPCSTRCPTAGAAGSNIPTEVVALLHPPLPFYLFMLGVYHLRRGVLEHRALLHDDSVSGGRDTDLLVDGIARISNRISIRPSPYLWKHRQAVIGSGTQ